MLESNRARSWIRVQAGSTSSTSGFKDTSLDETDACIDVQENQGKAMPLHVIEVSELIEETNIAPTLDGFDSTMPAAVWTEGCNVHDGAHKQMLIEYEGKKERLVETEHLLGILRARFDDEIVLLEKEKEHLVCEVAQLYSLMWERH